MEATELSRLRSGRRVYDRGTLAGPALVGLLRFRPSVQLSARPQHLLLIGLAILGEQFHRSREPALIFPEDIGAVSWFCQKWTPIGA